jgi:predicted transcriptional regulator of viral defense system
MLKRSIKDKQGVKRALSLFRKRQGIMRTGEALKAGIHRETLYAMRKAGLIEVMAHGVNRLVDSDEPASPDLVIIAQRIPAATICLVSALSFHEITTQIPRAVEIMLPRGHRIPRMDYPPIEAHTSMPRLYQMGREAHPMGGTEVHVYDVEKTLVDCVKFRNKLGTEVVIEALRLYRDRKPLRIDSLMDYARACRVQQILQTYLEGIL